MRDDYRLCPKCGKQQRLDYYLPVYADSEYGVGGKSAICIECIAKNIDRKDLHTIDKMCQYLDLPFDPNKWVEMEQEYEKLGPLLTDYCFELVKGEYAESDWTEVNKAWEKCR